MATVTLQITQAEACGNHFELTLSGDLTGTRRINAEELQWLYDNVTKDDLIAVMLRLVKSGRTLAQAKALLQAGVTVTV